MKNLDYNAPIVPGGSFSWGEYALLREWDAFARPTAVQQDNARFLFTQLQPLRERLGHPLIISSGARTGAYTRYLRSRGVPAALQSAHLDWQAVDLQCPGMTTATLWSWLAQHWPGRMENLAATPGWVHLDTRSWGQRLRFNP
jgi:uncharacterized protein YcbK (DUF882 family)